MLNKRMLALLGFCALVCVVALVKYRPGRRADSGAEHTATIGSTTESLLSPGVLGTGTLPPKKIARADQAPPAKTSDDALAAAPAEPVYLESVGVPGRDLYS